MRFPKEMPAPIQLAELTELRRAEAEAVWLRLCADFLQDAECNQAAEMARAAITAQAIDSRARLWRVIGLPGPTFKFPRDFGFRGAASPRLVATFLRLVLFPAALGKVARDAQSGLGEFRAATLRAEKALEAPVRPVDPLLPEGTSDEDVRHDADFGVFDEKAPDDRPEVEDELITVPELHQSALTEMTRLFERLKATGRFTSKKHRHELRAGHRNLRRLVEHAYPPESHQDLTTQRVHEGSIRALGFLARVLARRRKSLSPSREIAVISAEFTGKITELAELVKVRQKPSNARRYKRVSKALGRE